MSTEESQMIWRMMVAVYPSCMEQVPPPSEIQKHYPEASIEQIIAIHQEAVAGLAWDYSSSALALIRQKRKEGV